MKTIKNKLRVAHFAQIPCNPFLVEVSDEIEAKKITDILTMQHLFLLKNNMIDDYSNIIIIEMFEEDSDGDGNPGWCNYFNEEEGMDWDEFEREHLSHIKVKTNLKD